MGSRCWQKIVIVSTFFLLVDALIFCILSLQHPKTFQLLIQGRMSHLLSQSSDTSVVRKESHGGAQNRTLLLEGQYNADAERLKNKLLEDEKNRKAFQSIMSEEDRMVMRELLEVFVNSVTEAGLTYFMYGGTLLGSYRHHGPIEWDDDIDLLLPVTQKLKLKATMKALEPKYRLYTQHRYRWKFYSKHSKPIKKIPWKYPFLDLCFYKQNASFIWDQDPAFSPRFKFHKFITFPLVQRPFWGMMLNAPKDTLRTLKRNYLIDACVNNLYNHKEEHFMPKQTHVQTNCSNLWERFPFVFRTYTSQGVNETLKIGDEVLQSILNIEFTAK